MHIFFFIIQNNFPSCSGDVSFGLRGTTCHLHESDQLQTTTIRSIPEGQNQVPPYVFPVQKAVSPGYMSQYIGKK